MFQKFSFSQNKDTSYHFFTVSRKEMSQIFFFNFTIMPPFQLTPPCVGTNSSVNLIIHGIIPTKFVSFSWTIMKEKNKMWKGKQSTIGASWWKNLQYKRFRELFLMVQFVSTLIWFKGGIRFIYVICIYLCKLVSYMISISHDICVVTRQVPLMEHELLTFLEYPSSSQVLMGFVSLNL
jgi:hypothetical protein